MRALVLATILAVPVLAGCLADPLSPTDVAALGFDPQAILAEGGRVEAIAGAARVIWELDIPTDGKRLELTIPEGVTMVDVRATWEPTVPGVTLLGRESGPMRRCARFDELSGNAFTCRGLTVLDPLPATWAFDLAPRGGVAVPLRMEAVLTGGPLTGPAGSIQLDRLSKPVFDILDTEAAWVASSLDGTPLFVEVTRPDTGAPVPAVIISSPYNNPIRVAGEVPYRGNPYGTSLSLVPRGYAVVVADVRGYANSGGCVDVWGRKEQQDQADLVDWVAKQPWSDGNVGFYGQSYVGTTAVEGAIMAPEALKAIIAVAPVNDPYYDWHFGGVPNGEQWGSPWGYHQIGAEVPTYEEDTVRFAELLAMSHCDSVPFTLRANDPRAVYDDFYAERNASAKAGDVKAAVLYTQGYFDLNVKSSLATHWFNDLDVPKKGLFGPWYHRHPPRADQELYFHAWWDQFLKGIDTGILAGPAAESLTLQGTWRGGATWPPAQAQDWVLFPDASSDALLAEPAADASGQYVALPARDAQDLRSLAFFATTPVPVGVPVPAVPVGAQAPTGGLWFTLPASTERRYLAGEATLDLLVTIEGATNSYLAAYLYEKEGDALDLITFGMRNVALRNGYERYEPVAPGDTVPLAVPFLPTEWVLQPGKELVLEVRAAFPSDWAYIVGNPPGIVTVHTGDGNAALRLPLLAEPGDLPAPGPTRVA